MASGSQHSTIKAISHRMARLLSVSALPEGVPVIVPAARFLADAAEILERDTPLGVIWPNNR
jgi:hypothetical protein